MLQDARTAAQNGFLERQEYSRSRLVLFVYILQGVYYSKTGIARHSYICIATDARTAQACGVKPEPKRFGPAPTVNLKFDI